MLDVRNMENPWKLKSTKKIYDNPWITLHEEQVINPQGGDSLYGRVHYKNLAIAIVPLDEALNTWLVGQWRYTLNEYSWEIPMGGGPLEVDPLESAKRELKEETGLTAHDWDCFLKIHTSNSVTDEVGYCYTAKGLIYGETEFDETEDLAIKKVPFRQAFDMCMSGKITDSLSLAALLKLGHVLKF